MVPWMAYWIVYLIVDKWWDYRQDRHAMFFRVVSIYVQICIQIFNFMFLGKYQNEFEGAAIEFSFLRCKFINDNEFPRSLKLIEQRQAVFLHLVCISLYI